jgi:hypothetical protein
MRLGFGEILVLTVVFSVVGFGIPIAGRRRARRRSALGGASMAAVVLAGVYVALVLGLVVRAAVIGTTLGMILFGIMGLYALAWLRAAVAANRAVKTGMRL